MVDSGPRHRVLPWTRLVFVAAVIAALVLGYVGIEQFIATLPAGQFGTGFWDVAYYTLQLFVLGAQPLDVAGPYPLALDIARFAAPAATVYALFEAARAVFAGQFRRWRIRTRRGNVIVVGESTAAATLVTRLSASRGQRSRIVAVPVADVDSLRDAGIARASVVYAFADDSDDSTRNVATALAAAAGRRSRRRAKLRVYAQVSDARLALALRARRLGLQADDGLHLDFVNLDEVAARGLVTASDVDPPGEAHIAVAGLGTFGRAVLIEYARRWRLESPRRDERVRATVVDPRARLAVADLVACWDVVREVFEFTAVDGDLGGAAGVLNGGQAPHRTYVCYDDEDYALAAALTTPDLWHGGPESIVVRLNRLARHGDAFHAQGRQLLDDLGGRLRLIGVTDLACDPDLIAADLTERLAEAIHERYLIERLSQGARLGADSAAPSLRAWADLPEHLRVANRAQAADIGVKLAMVGCAVAPRSAAGSAFAFAPAEIERLAVHEHDRWSAERRAQGFRYGPTRDARHLPSLVPWDDLPEPERDKDREAVRNLPSIVNDVGLHVVRLDGVATVAS